MKCHNAFLNCATGGGYAMIHTNKQPPQNHQLKNTNHQLHRGRFCVFAILFLINPTICYRKLVLKHRIPNREITPDWAYFNEILAEARMKSAMQMKSKPMAWMKLNPPTATAISSDRRDDFTHPQGWI